MIGSTVPTVTIFTIRETLRESGQHLIAVKHKTQMLPRHQRSKGSRCYISDPIWERWTGTASV